MKLQLVKDLNAMTIRDYIESHYKSQADFANKQGVLPQQVTKWIAKNYIVVNGVLYRPMQTVNRGF